MKNLLAIDIGSNSLKSLCISYVDGKIVEGQSLTLPIRITKGSCLVEDAASKISYAIKHFVDSQDGDFQVRAVATSAMRTSPNAEAICKEVFDNTGVLIEVIEGSREAYLSVLGAMYDSSIKVPDEFVFMDLGGGSLELAYCKDKSVIKVESLPIGAVRLTESFIQKPSEKIAKDRLENMRIHCQNSLDTFNICNESNIAIATGGAVAAAKYMLEHLGLKSFNEPLSLCDLEFLLDKISQESLEDRIKNYAIPANRADIIPASFLCLIATMQKFRLEKILYANQSLRRGICVEHFIKGDL